MRKSLYGTILALVLVAVPLWAHEGHAHRYMGTITAVQNSQVELKTTAGKTMLFKLDDTTKITLGPQKGGKEDLKVGIRAVVEADEASKPATAKAIKLPAAQKS